MHIAEVLQTNVEDKLQHRVIITREEKRRRKREAPKTFLVCHSTPALLLSTDSWHTNEDRL